MLNEILEAKGRTLKAKKEKLSLADLKKRLQEKEKGEATFLSNLMECSNEVRIIGEIKRASPSCGRILRGDADILEIARMYEMNGVSALSILTEENFFLGSIEDIERIKGGGINLPILRKDFILEEYEVYESKYIRADAILLIVRILDDVQMRSFYDLAKELSLDVIFEVHDEEDLERALGLGPKIIGINNRDLDSLKIDLNVSVKLLPLIPEGIFKITESGIRSYQDIVYLKSLGADAFLIGESILRSDDISKKLRELLGYG